MCNKTLYIDNRYISYMLIYILYMCMHVHVYKMKKANSKIMIQCFFKLAQDEVLSLESEIAWTTEVL